MGGVVRWLICLIRGHAVRRETSYWPLHAIVYYCTRCGITLLERKS